MGEQQTAFHTRSIHELDAAEYCRYLGIVRRAIEDTMSDEGLQNLKEEEAKEAAALSWLTEGDEPFIDNNPQVIKVRSELQQHRHDGQESRHMELCRLTEWLVALELVSDEQADLGLADQVA